MSKVTDCLISVFPDADASTINGETLLGDLPGWDSMNSVNVLMELEAVFSVSLADEVLTSKEHVSDIAEMLRRHGAQV